MDPDEHTRHLAADSLAADDPTGWFDTQIRALLGETPPAPAELDRRATRAVRRFLALTAP